MRRHLGDTVSRAATVCLARRGGPLTNEAKWCQLHDWNLASGSGLILRMRRITRDELLPEELASLWADDLGHDAQMLIEHLDIGLVRSI